MRFDLEIFGVLNRLGFAFLRIVPDFVSPRNMLVFLGARVFFIIFGNLSHALVGWCFPCRTWSTAVGASSSGAR